MMLGEFDPKSSFIVVSLFLWTSVMLFFKKKHTIIIIIQYEYQISSRL